MFDSLQNFFKKLGKKSDCPVDLPVGHMEPDDRRVLPIDLGADSVTNPVHKLEMAKTLVNSFLEWGDLVFEQVLVRKLDVRLCSMISYQLAAALFDVGGASVYERRPDIAQLMRLKLTVSQGRNVIDHSFEADFLMPVKYRGYGHPIYSRKHIGHLFQVNINCFPDDSRVIGYRDNHDGDIHLLKGLKKLGNAGGWHLYQLEPDMTDDLTAIFTVDSLLPDRLIEICHYKGNDADSPIIYRFSKN